MTVRTTHRGNAAHTCVEAGFPYAIFELYALSKTIDLPADATRAQLLDAIKDIIVGKAAYVGSGVRQ